MPGSRPEIRLLAYQRSTNPGGVLFSVSVLGAISSASPAYRVRTLDYVSPRRRLYQAAKAIKPELTVPLFNARRHLMYRRFVQDELILDRKLPPFASSSDVVRYLNSQHVAAAIVGMDTWNISADWFLEPFPSVYWLPAKLRGLKVAYSVSAHRSSLSGVEAHKEEIRRLLDDFALIGVRDHFTQDLVSNVGVRRDLPVKRVADPAFLLPLETLDKGSLREKYGLESRPIMGLLIYGRSEFSKASAALFRACGYQVVAPSMYSPYADRNLGHRMDPYEWANFFQCMDFCVTDRFHGAIFCLKSRTPFLAVEPYPLESPQGSKHRSLLQDFGLLDCYLDPHTDGHRDGDVQLRVKHIQSRWEGWLPSIESGIAAAHRQHEGFLAALNGLLMDRSQGLHTNP